MHAAENNVFARSVRGFLRKLVGVATEISEANHLIALVMMAEDY
jgi:hypothetical protein